MSSAQRHQFLGLAEARKNPPAVSKSAGNWGFVDVKLNKRTEQAKEDSQSSEPQTRPKSEQDRYDHHISRKGVKGDESQEYLWVAHEIADCILALYCKVIEQSWIGAVHSGLDHRSFFACWTISSSRSMYASKARVPLGVSENVVRGRVPSNDFVTAT